MTHELCFVGPDSLVELYIALCNNRIPQGEQDDNIPASWHKYFVYIEPALKSEWSEFMPLATFRAMDRASAL